MKPLININKPGELNTEGKSAMYMKLKRITGAEGPGALDDAGAASAKNDMMKVMVRPNPFSSSITFEVTSEQGKNVIVRIFNEDGRIVKLFSWFLLKGVNNTTVNDMDTLSSGDYELDMIDHEGKLLFCTKITRQL